MKIRSLSLDDHRKLGKKLRATLRDINWIESVLIEHYGDTHVTVDAYWNVEAALNNLRSKLEDMLLCSVPHAEDDAEVLNIYYGVE